MTKSKFPPIVNGSCDGHGCGYTFCFCNEHTAMKEEFQRVYDKQWKESYDENPDIDCNRVDHMWGFGTERANALHETQLGYKQDKIKRLKDKLETFFITFIKDGKVCVERCDGDKEANAFVRENNLSVEDDCQVISGGYILSRDNRSQMWFYKIALNK